MKNSFHNIISLFLISGILIAVFYKYPDRDKIDFKKQIVDFTRYEDTRDIDIVLYFFEFPLLEYWQHKKLSKSELKKIYESYWARFGYSKNEIQKIEKISDFEFVLTTKYIFRKSIDSDVNRYRFSETKFKFNELGKIISITNLSLKKIDHQYIIDNNLIRDFSYSEKIFKKNNPDLAIFFSIFLLFNLLIQAFITNNTKSKTVKVTTTNNKNSNKVAGKKVSNENLRDKSINELKLKEQVALDELNNPIEKEKKVIKDKAFKEVLIKAEKARIETEKKLAALQEAERIRKNKIAKEKRQEKVRIEKEKIIAVQKANAEAKRKRANDRRLEKERLEKEKKLAARREASRNKREEEEARIKREKAVIKKRQDKEREKRIREDEVISSGDESNIVLVEEDEDDFFDDNLSQYITEIPDDDIDETESDIAELLADKYMSQKLKNKLKNK